MATNDDREPPLTEREALKYRLMGSATAIAIVAFLVFAVPALSQGRDDDGSGAPATTPRAPQSERDPNQTGSSSFFLGQEVDPGIDREAAFERWGREFLRDPHTVKAVRLGPAFKAYSSLIPPVRDWMMCGEFNARGEGGGYVGLQQFLFVMRDSDGDGRWRITRVDDRGHGTWREHCIPFMKEGRQ